MSRIIDCSTVHPDTTSMTAKAIEARGGKFVACPLVCALTGPKEKVAEKTGLGVDALHQFLEMMFPGPYVAYPNRMQSGDYHKREELLFAVDLAMKDARHAQALVNKAGVHMKNMEVANEYLKVVKEQEEISQESMVLKGSKKE